MAFGLRAIIETVMRNGILLFSVVFVLNVLPAFAPPTWMVLSFAEWHSPTTNVTLLALIGAMAATLGRYTLAKLSRVILRHKVLSAATRRNIDTVRDGLERRRALTMSVFLFYALSPLPSNVLFIAYGLTSLQFSHIVVPFFLGRFISYHVWVLTAEVAPRSLAVEFGDAPSYLSGYFIASQLLLLALVYTFIRLDWRALYIDKRLRWLKDRPPEERAPEG
jgi:hypothetical protein